MGYRKSDAVMVVSSVLIIVIMVSLYQIQHTNLAKKRYMDSITLGGEWFLNNQDASFLYYEYNFLHETHSDKVHPLREMGALWSITRLSEFLKDERYDALARKGFDYFEDSFSYDEENDFYFVNVTPGSVKLGYSAFIILALLGIDDADKEEYLRGFAKGIIFLQEDSGELRTFFYSGGNSERDYYPGEALVALMHLYEYTGNEEYLLAVKKAFPFYVGYFRENPNTAFVPWQSRAYRRLFNATQDEEVADFVFEMNDFMVKQGDPGKECSDFGFAGGIVIAVYMEGMVKAYDLAMELGDAKRADCYLNYIREASDHIMSLQVTEDSRKESIGGFLGSESSQTMRVDRNQHAVMAFMDAYDLMF